MSSVLETRTLIGLIASSVLGGIVLATPALAGWVTGYELVLGACAFAVIAWVGSAIAVRAARRRGLPS
jgi:hypothetical protein